MDLFGSKFGRDAELKPKAGIPQTPSTYHNDIPELVALRQARQQGSANSNKSRQETPPSIGRNTSYGSNGSAKEEKGFFGSIVNTFKLFDDDQSPANSPESASHYNRESPQHLTGAQRQSSGPKQSRSSEYTPHQNSEYRQRQRSGSAPRPRQSNNSWDWNPGSSKTRGYDIGEDLRRTKAKLEEERRQREELEDSLEMMQEEHERKEKENEDLFSKQLHELRIHEAIKAHAIVEMHKLWNSREETDDDGGGAVSALMKKSSSKKEGTQKHKKSYYKKRLLRSTAHPGAVRLQFHRSGAELYRCQAALLRQAHLDSKNRGMTHVVKEGTIFEPSDRFLTIALFSASGLPNVDTFGKTDGYIKFVIGDQVVKSEYIRNDLDPTWNQLFCFEIFASYKSYPGITLQVYDHNDFNPDEFIGIVEVKWNAITGSSFEVPILGGNSPDHIDGTRCGILKFQVLNARVVEKGFQQGAKMTKQHFDHLQSIANVGEGADDKPHGLTLFKGSTHFKTVAIFSASSLPKMDTFGSCDCYVKVVFGDEVLQTEIKKNTLNPDWNQIFCLEVYPRYLSSSPGVIFEFWDKDNFKSDDYIGKVEVQWDAIHGRELELPILGGTDRNHVDGSRQGFVRLQVANAEVVGKDFRQGMEMTQQYFQELAMISRDENQLKEQDLKSRTPSVSVAEEPETEGTSQVQELFEEADYNLVIALYAGTGLPIVDLIGSCDPYVIIRVGDESIKSGYKKNTLNPEFFQIFSFEMLASYYTRYEGVIFEVYDHNNITEDEYLGKIEYKWEEIDGQSAEYPILGGRHPQDYDGTSKGQLQFQVVKARPMMKDFQQGMVIEEEHFEALSKLVSL